MYDSRYFTLVGLSVLTVAVLTSRRGWICVSGWAGVELDDFPTLKAWEERMAARPGVEKGRHVPERHTHKELLQDKERMKELEERGKHFTAKSAQHTAEKKT